MTYEELAELESAVDPDYAAIDRKTALLYWYLRTMRAMIKLN